MRTTLPLVVYPDDHGVDPSRILVGDIGLHSDNARLGRKLVIPVGPQQAGYNVGTVEYHNSGLTMTPEIRRWLELGSQRQTGLYRRTERRTVTEPWDQPYIMNPSVEPEAVG